MRCGSKKLSSTTTKTTIVETEGARCDWRIGGLSLKPLDSGASFEAGAQQLGHTDTSMAVRVYGRFRPTANELRGWHKVAQAQDRKGATK